MPPFANELIIREIVSFVEKARASGSFLTRWHEPLVGFADASDALFGRLREWTGTAHFLPHDLLPGARSVTAYFLPFEKGVSLSNRAGKYPSSQWARAYIETNALITSLNAHLTGILGGHGISTAEIPPTRNFDHQSLVSLWSHRHVAYIAGLGTFGANNMLITERGCCGRLGSLVITAECKPSSGPGYELCLSKNGGSCLACVRKCPSGALQEHSFDRRRCYSILMKNAGLYEKLGLADVCGKCLCNVPCSHTNPAGERALSQRPDE